MRVKSITRRYAALAVAVLPLAWEATQLLRGALQEMGKPDAARVVEQFKQRFPDFDTKNAAEPDR